MPEGLRFDSSHIVSIPSRGSGKGDAQIIISKEEQLDAFQSPLGEVVKETLITPTC